MTMIQVSNNSRKRSLVSTRVQHSIHNRVREIFGIMIGGIGFLFLLALLSYDFNDPSFRNATGLIPNNLLKLPGSYASDLMFTSLGIGSFFLPIVLLSWSYRIIIKGTISALFRRTIFIPFGLVVSSIFLSTNEVPEYWPFMNGLGGVTGDTCLEYILKKHPIEIDFWLKIISSSSGILLVLSLSFCAGVTFGEGKKIIKGFTKNIIQLVKFFTFDIFILSNKIFKFTSIKDNQNVRENSRTPTNFSDLFNFTRQSRIYKPSNEQVSEDEVLTQKTDESVHFSSATSEHMSTFSKSQIFFPQKKSSQVSSKAKLDLQPSLGLEKKHEEFELPSLSLLETKVEITNLNLSEDSLQENARMLESVLDDYGVKGKIISVRPGPVVTLYELEPAAGIKASRVISLSDDIARSMSALAARVSTIPGRSVIGIELPNADREKVLLREILASRPYGDSKFQLPLALGKDIGGEPIIVNLARMPHLLIAGTTGSGKSVGINTMILSLLYSLSPDDCRLIMIDPKMLELSVYDGIPHLLSPVVTDPKKAVVALKWAVLEMEDRYKKMSKLGVRNIENYNNKVQETLIKGENFSKTVQVGFDEITGEPKFEEQFFEPKKLPFIIIIVDEMADLMMVAGKEIEACIQRLAQMARAAGIHLIMATQRPSVDVITGTIKANFPTRISFQVTSKIDSRTILGEMGGEQLLGMGDMLFMANGGKITRIHGPFVSDLEVEKVVAHIKNQRSANYEASVLEGPDPETENKLNKSMGLLSGDNDEDASLYDLAVSIVAKDQKCSTSYIQRKLSIGYNRAAKIVEEMENNNIVSAANHVGKREILINQPIQS